MVRLRSLGQCVIEIGETRLTPAAERMFAITLYLVLEGGRPIGRRELMELIWPRASEARAHHCLRQALYRLSAMGAVLRSERAHVVLPHHSFESDCAALLAAQDEAELEQLADQAGPFLPGYAPTFSALFSDWLDRQRDLINSALRRVLVAGMVAKKERGQWHLAERLATRCLSVDPLNEEATLTLAEVAAMQGSKVRALDILDRYLREIGPEARELRVPATVLRRRIAEVYRGEGISVPPIPHVGREAELAELTRALQLARSGQGSAVLIWGEPGIGKTRLLVEFTRRAAVQEVQVARALCQSHDERRPLSAFVDLVPRLLELRGALGCSPESMKYLKRLIAHDPSSTTLSPDSQDAEFLFSSIRRAVLDLLDAIAGEGPVIVAIDDAHWLDAMSWELLRDLVPWLATRRALVLLTSRSVEVVQRLDVAGPPAPLVLSLRPLAESAGRELVESVVAGTERAGDAAFVDWCVAAGGGNPYYLSELALRATWDGEGYRAPLTLHTLVRDRLARLSGISKRVLQACCVLGKLSTLERLELVLDEKRVALLGALDELERLRLIEVDDGRLLCKHELLAAAALEQLSSLARSLLHRHAAQVLEQEVMATGSPTVLWECARHWQQVGERERVIDLIRSCARHSLEIGSPLGGAALLEEATKVATDAEMVVILRERAAALHLAEYWEPIPGVIERVGEVLRRLGKEPDPHTDEELLTLEAKWHTGHSLRQLLDAAISCAQSIRSPKQHRIRAAILAFTFAGNLCDPTGMAELFQEITPLLQNGGIPRALEAYLLMIYHSTFGDVRLAASAAEDLLRHTRLEGNIATISRHLRHASGAYVVAGRIPQALDAATEAFHLATQVRLRNAATSAALYLSYIYIQLEQFPEADYWYAEARRWYTSEYSPALKSFVGTYAVRLALWKRDYDEAERVLHTIRHELRAADGARSTAECLALEVGLELGRGRVPTDAMLDELLHYHHQARTGISHDYFVGTMLRALDARGLQATGDKLLIEYARTHRRELAPLPPSLQARLTTAEQRSRS
jgi:DNA-binding SARP family transcriptional activator